tara:strand:- start:2455 stop:2670 length:216 start_codon:yes stop_codon:yes gene_type:complete
MKITVEKNGITQDVKQVHLQNFLDRGWTATAEKKVSRIIGKAKVTADVIEEEVTPPTEEQSSMPNHNQGEE